MVKKKGLTIQNWVELREFWIEIGTAENHWSLQFVEVKYELIMLIS